MNLCPVVVKRVQRELCTLLREEIGGICVKANEDMSTVEAEISGPENTPFEGGVFGVRLVLDAEYPDTPPKGYFLTKIFHPNVSVKGEICVNVLKKDWHRDCGLKHVLMVIRCLLIEPNPESALNMEAGHLLLEDYEEFYKRAKLFTQLYAVKETSKENIPSSEAPVTSLPPGKPAAATSSALSSITDNSMGGVGADTSPKKKVVEKKRTLKRL
eukprot:RCo017387